MGCCGMLMIRGHLENERELPLQETT